MPHPSEKVNVFLNFFSSLKIGYESISFKKMGETRITRYNISELNMVKSATLVFIASIRSLRLATTEMLLDAAMT